MVRFAATLGRLRNTKGQRLGVSGQLLLPGDDTARNGRRAAADTDLGAVRPLPTRPSVLRGRWPPLTGSRVSVLASSSASSWEALGVAFSLPTDCQKFLQPLRKAASSRLQSLWCGWGELPPLRGSLPAMAAGAARDAPQGHARSPLRAARLTPRASLLPRLRAGSLGTGNGEVAQSGVLSPTELETLAKLPVHFRPQPREPQPVAWNPSPLYNFVTSPKVVLSGTHFHFVWA